MKKILFPILITLWGCSFNFVIPLSHSIPLDIQQRIKTSSIEGISFNFQPITQAENISFKVGTNIYNYSINQPFVSLVNEWVETKFGSVNINSEDELKITIIDFSDSTTPINAMESNFNHKISMTVEISCQINNISKTKQITYQTVIPVNNIKIYEIVMSKAINNFLLKYLIGMDKFIDSSYEIKG